MFVQGPFRGQLMLQLMRDRDPETFARLLEPMDPSQPASGATGELAGGSYRPGIVCRLSDCRDSGLAHDCLLYLLGAQRGIWLESCMASSHEVIQYVASCLPSKDCAWRWVALGAQKGRHRSVQRVAVTQSSKAEAAAAHCCLQGSTGFTCG